MPAARRPLKGLAVFARTRTGRSMRERASLRAPAPASRPLPRCGCQVGSFGCPSRAAVTLRLAAVVPRPGPAFDTGARIRDTFPRRAHVLRLAMTDDSAAQPNLRAPPAKRDRRYAFDPVPTWALTDPSAWHALRRARAAGPTAPPVHLRPQWPRRPRAWGEGN